VKSVANPCRAQYEHYSTIAVPSASRVRGFPCFAFSPVLLYRILISSIPAEKGLHRKDGKAAMIVGVLKEIVDFFGSSGKAV
jgi:hypothetical protein